MVMIGLLSAALQVSAVTRVDASTPENVQVAIAESAAPAAVAADAAVYIIAESGYRKVRDGRNGFTCLISRQYRNTLEPECFDAEGTATVLPARLFVERRRAEGADDVTVERELEDAYRSHRFVAPRRPGIVYMLSPHNYVLDPESKQIVHFPGHLMFYAPYATQKDVGSGPGAPFIVSPGTPHALMVVVPAGAMEHK